VRGNGINFDTGFLSAGTSTREPFDPEVVRREMRIIRDDLHCNAVRITGGDADRLEIAARYAADAGLAVWFCPFTNGLTQDALLERLADCAERAERLRRGGADVVMLTGSEVSLFTLGFFPGDTLEERVALIGDPIRVRAAIADVRARMKDFLQRAVAVVRASFGGKLSYASLPFEAVDWSLFDIIATDAGYRTKENASHYRESIRAFVAQGRSLGKPVAITEFGCGSFRGASEFGRDPTFSLIVWGDDGRAAKLNRECERDENEQANYLRELIDVFESEGVDFAFVYTFARYDFPHREDPGRDIDRVSAGVVKVFDEQSGTRQGRYADMPWEPKAAFSTIADCYGDWQLDTHRRRGRDSQ
jgi:hypothetical protein